MSRKDIEARLDRSLANQIRVPRLDRRFDAAVMARIEAEEARAARPAAAAPSSAVRASRWLAITNWVGISVTLAIAVVFVVRTYGGVEPSVNLGVNVPVPAVPEETVAQLIGTLGQVLGYVALAFGLSLTSIGRRLRASFS